MEGLSLYIERLQPPCILIIFVFSARFCQYSKMADMGSPVKDPKTVDVETSRDPSVGVIEGVVRVVDHQAERALCRKFDFRLLPLLAFMCREFPSVFSWCNEIY